MATNDARGAARTLFAAGTGIGLVAASAFASPTTLAFDQDANRSTDRDRIADANRADAATFDPVRLDTLLGSDVIATTDGRQFGTLRDLVVDRGDGRIRAALVTIDADVADDEPTVVVPWTRVDGVTANGALTLAIDGAALRAMPSAEADRLDVATFERFLEDAGESISNAWTVTGDAIDDVLGLDLDETSSEQVRGTIVAVDRTPGDAEHVQVEILDGDGRVIPVMLGPSWFVLAHDPSVRTGDDVEAIVFRLPGENADGEHAEHLIAREFRRGETAIVMRDEEGRPNWRVSVFDGGDSSARVADDDTRWMLATKLTGRDVVARDRASGSVDDLLVDRTGGRIAYLLVDPDEAPLGLGDDLRLVPWRATSIGRELIGVDATRDAILASSLPDRVDRLRAISARRSLDARYGLVPRDARTSSRPGERAWTSNDRFAKAMRDAATMRIAGEVIGVERCVPHAGLAPAWAATIDTLEGPKRVILTPVEASISSDLLRRCHLGERVSIEAARVELGDEPTWFATTLESSTARDAGASGANDETSRPLRLWRDGTPAWSSDRDSSTG